MNIKIYNEIDSPELEEAWNRIVAENNYFPQSSYGWCAPWWRRLSGRLELYIIAVIDDEGSICALAPMCIEKKVTMKILRSFPVHFGDFFTFLVPENNSKYYYSCILNHMQSYSHWEFIRIEQVNNKDSLYKYFI
ncbi:MAG: hypothetical protein GY756_06870, partial [bacterium]|nr:hypothetical protein [bacterium]